jgi:hypothetical protein
VFFIEAKNEDEAGKPNRQAAGRRAALITQKAASSGSGFAAAASKS